MTAAVLAQELLGHVDGVLVFGVASHVLEDVHGLKRFGERTRSLAQNRVLLLPDTRRMLVPEIGEHVTHSAGDVIAVLPIFVDALDPDAVWVREHELAHPGDHLRGPTLHVCARSLGKGAEADEYQVCVQGEPHVSRLAGQIANQLGEAVGVRCIVKAPGKVVEQLGLTFCRHDRLVFDGIGNPADQIPAQNGLSE